MWNSRRRITVLLSLALALIPTTAQAALFQLSGDITDGTTIRGAFTVVFDDASQLVLTDADLPNPADSLVANFFSYDLISVAATFDGVTFGTVAPNDTFAGSPVRDIFFEGSPFGGSIPDIFTTFVGATDLLILGRFTETQVGNAPPAFVFGLENMGIYLQRPSFDLTDAFYTNLTLQQLPDPPIPEPGTLVLLSTALVGLGIARRRKH